MAAHIRIDEAQRLSLPGRVATRLVDMETRGADMTVRFVEVAPEDKDAEPRPRHVHTQTGEFVWVLEGRGMVQAAGEPFRVSPGEGVYVPSGEAHKIEPLDNRPLRLLCFFTTGDITAGTKE